MPIKIVEVKEEGKEYPLYGPVVLCSSCEKRITAKNGRYAWAIKEGHEVIGAYYHNSSQPEHLACYGGSLEWQTRMEANGYQVLWGDYVDFVPQLAHNLGIKRVERMTIKMENSVHGLLTIMRGFLYIDGDAEKCKELVREIHEVQLWLEEQKAERQGKGER